MLPNLHMLRHTYISVAIAAGVPEFDVSVLVAQGCSRTVPDVLPDPSYCKKGKAVYPAK